MHWNKMDHKENNNNLLPNYLPHSLPHNCMNLVYFTWRCKPLPWSAELRNAFLNSGWHKDITLFVHEALLRPSVLLRFWITFDTSLFLILTRSNTCLTNKFNKILWMVKIHSTHRKITQATTKPTVNHLTIWPNSETTTH